MGKLVIFLGAGASASEGAPIQSKLFSEYFALRSSEAPHSEMHRELVTFFHSFFGIDADLPIPDATNFPTFEEALGLLDLSILRKESFKGFSLENVATNSGRIRFIYNYLIFLLAEVLEKCLRSDQGHHFKLVSKLVEHNAIRDTVFVSTNYDILIDSALTAHHRSFDVDYGIPFREFYRDIWHAPDPKNSVKLFKPHGSLNWLFCPTCAELIITPGEKGVYTWLLEDPTRSPCFACDTPYVPLIVPPTYYKDLNNPFLSTIWNQTDISIRNAETVVFCGYSFPDADLHIKYLLKRAQMNGLHAPRFVVVNEHAGKKGPDRDAEKERYSRFLGTSVNFSGLSFQEFSEDPFSVL